MKNMNDVTIDVDLVGDKIHLFRNNRWLGSCKKYQLHQKMVELADKINNEEHRGCVFTVRC